MAEQQSLHGTALAIGQNGVLLRGPSGVGKSDLALRCLALPSLGLAVDGEKFQLIADDRVFIDVIGDRLVMRAPAALHGLLEVRGVGILSLRAQDTTRADMPIPLTLVVDLVNAPVERLPPEPPEMATIADIDVARITLVAFEASAPLKLALALSVATGAAHRLA